MTDFSVSSKPAIAVERYYQIIRGQIEHEDNLIGQRLSWLVAAESFLFTAYAIVISNSGVGHLQWVTEKMRALLLLIPALSVLTCLLIYITIIAGVIAIRDLNRLYQSFTAGVPPIGLPPVRGYRRTQILGQAAPLFVPAVFLITWMILLLHGPP